MTQEIKVEITDVAGSYFSETRHGRFYNRVSTWDCIATVKRGDQTLDVGYEFEDVVGDDNGGTGCKITTKRPKGMKTALWDEIEEHVRDAAGEDYGDRRGDYQESLDDMR